MPYSGTHTQQKIGTACRSHPVLSVSTTAGSKTLYQQYEREGRGTPGERAGSYYLRAELARADGT